MSRRRKSSDSAPFDTVRLEGSLFVPELLERAARGEATAQKESDYAIPKGLKLHDEYGRAFRIATALWQDFAPQLPRKDQDSAPPTYAFVLDFLRQCLGYTDLSSLSAPVLEGDRGFPITSLALGGRLPVIIAPHSLGLDDPDPRFAIHGSGSRKKSAYQLAQEYLNASRDCLWAIATNGRTLRLLRDAETLTRPNFLEFDLETILRESEVRYADFSALWRLLHVSRAGTARAPSQQDNPLAGLSPQTTSSPSDCIWEKWKSEGHAQGLRVRDGLRDGVQEALLTLGGGFLSHPDNTALRQRLQDGSLTKEDYFQQLLRLIYRSLFLFCAEERDLLHPPDSDPAARSAYAAGYSLRRLRRRSLRHTAHDPHSDLWLSLRLVFRCLAQGETRLALPALGGLFAPAQCPDLDSATLTNRDLLSAMRPLRWFFDKKTGKRSAIDYRNMGPEELGSVYESLLELVPTTNLAARTFGFAGITDTASTSGNARKTTGSYYTPDSLVQELIKSALDPVIANRLAAQPDRPIDALLSITVCDPSCGSGHFLLAAARRLAEKLAELRAPDGAVCPDDYRHALREVASRCLYGVDINPMAVELCRVALWLETVDPGKPLGFLNHHIRTGNSLLGTTPDLIAAGLPDDTFTAIEGDDKAACAELKKRNKKEREGFGPLFEKEEQTIRDRLRHAATQVEAMDDSQPAALQQKETAFTTSETAPEYRHAKLLADLWCAAFVIKKHFTGNDDTPVVSSPSPSPNSDLPSAIEGHLLHTQDELFGQSTPAPASKAATKKAPRKTENGTRTNVSGITTAHLRYFVQGEPLPADLQTEVEAIARQYRFFHWHLAFPQVFEQGGFDCILGNPPWEHTELKEIEWFAERRPEIANAKTSALRKRAIADLANSDPRLYRAFADAARERTAIGFFLGSSNHYPLCGRGRINLYAVFAENMHQLVSAEGRIGCIVPSEISSSDTTKLFFQHLISSKTLVSIFSFENEEFLFPGVHHATKFCLATIAGSKSRIKAAQFVFYARQVEAIMDDHRRFVLDEDRIKLLNPNTLTCPLFRSSQDAELTCLIYSRNPVLVNEGAEPSNPWGLVIRRIFNMGIPEVADLCIPSKSSAAIQDCLPMMEAKLMHQFDNRFADYSGDEAVEVTAQGKTDPTASTSPRYWVPEAIVRQKIPEGWKGNWLLCWRDITNTTNEHTVIAAALPFTATDFTLRLGFVTAVERQLAAALLANLNSFAFEYTARQSLGGTHLSDYIFKQLPAISPATLSLVCSWNARQNFSDWLLLRVLELTYTAWDLEPFAQDCGWPGPPFRWDEERRFLLRCELDAAFFHLYLGPQSEWQQQPEALTRAFPTPRHAVSYIMDTFPIVKRKDEAKYNGHYRTKETILQIYDALGEAMQSGAPYQTLLNPPPADPACCHPPRETISHNEPMHWQDSAFTLLAPVRKKVHNYPVAVWPELIRQWDKDLDFETFRKAYWLLCEPGQFELEGKKLLPDISASWWRSRKESLEAKDFLRSLKGAATIGELKILRKDGSRLIRWTGSLPEGLVHEAVDDARIALQVASQLSDDPSEEAMDMAGIESLLQSLETA